jgi:hypothetical protein
MPPVCHALRGLLCKYTQGKTGITKTQVVELEGQVLIIAQDFCDSLPDRALYEVI